MDRRRSLFVVYLAFFLSGAAGLIYQVVWARYLGLLLGSSGHAQILVLATFMGGLGLGAWLFGSRSDKTKTPLRLFIQLEIGITVYTALFPLLFPMIREHFLGTIVGMEPGSFSLLTLQAMLSIATILLPTALMGGTLPVLGRLLIDRLSIVGDRVAHLYYVNSFGAVFGALLAGFVLIQKIGLAGSMWVGSTFDFGTTILIAWAGKAYLAHAATKNEEAHASLPHEARPAEIYEPGIARVALIVIGISGAVSMIYEVAWIRMLALVMGSSTYSFSLMVAAFIFGISLGSFLLSFKKTDRDYFPLLGYCEILIGMTLLFSLPIYMQLPYLFNQFQGVLERTESAFTLFQLIKVAICFLAMLVPTIFIGMTLPAASKVVSRQMETLGSKIGSAFALNTLGTLCGAVIAGTVLLPFLGIKVTLFIGAAINIALGIWVIAVAPMTEKLEQRKLGMALVVVNTIGGFIIASLFWQDMILVRSTFRRTATFESREEYAEFLATSEIAYMKDGLDASVAVLETDNSVSLIINGKPDASAIKPGTTDPYKGDMPTQLLLGYIPMLAHPAPKNVLVVGQGSGITAGAVAMFPNVKVTVVELSPEVAEAAPYFAPANRRFWELPNVKHIVEDARTYMILADEKYDVIITEPSNPWVAGNASLFTKEFFISLKDHLSPNGLLLQWVHSYEMSDTSVEQIIRTLQSEFPYLSFWELAHGDYALLASPDSFAPNYAAMELKLNLPEVKKDFEAIGLSRLDLLFAIQFYNGMGAGADLVPSGPLNSEYRPLLEYSAPLGFFLSKMAGFFQRMDLRSHPQKSRVLWLNHYLNKMGDGLPALSREHWLTAYRAAWRGRPGGERQAYVLEQWKAAYPDDIWHRYYEVVRSVEIARPDRLRRLREEEFAPLWEEPEVRSFMLSAHEELVDEWSSDEPVGDDGDRILDWTEAILFSRSGNAYRFHALRGSILVRMGKFPAGEREFAQAIGLLNRIVRRMSQQGEPSDPELDRYRLQMIYLHAESRLMLIGKSMEEIGKQKAKEQISELFTNVLPILSKEELASLQTLAYSALSGDFLPADSQ